MSIAIKFGGSSFSGRNGFVDAADYVNKKIEDGYKPTIIVSAPKGISDLLLPSRERSSEYFIDLKEKLYSIYSDWLGDLDKTAIREELDILKNSDELNSDYLMALGENHSGKILLSFVKNAE